MPATPPPTKVHYVLLNRRSAAISVDDLAMMLELDIYIGDGRGLRRRLRKALEDAYRQGVTGELH